MVSAIRPFSPLKHRFASLLWNLPGYAARHAVLALTAAVVFGLTGCGMGAPTLLSTATAPSGAAARLSGNVYGGQQAIAGAKIYFYAVSTVANGAASTSLLSAPGYVTTDANGRFSVSNDFTCPAGAYVYLLALGGNPGLAANTINAELAMAAALGQCSSLSASSFFRINEVSTVAAAYSFAAIASSETQVGSTSAATIASAFGNVTNLINPQLGAALAVTPTGGGVVPQAEINTLANVLATCVNSDGTGMPCASLMHAANVRARSARPWIHFRLRST